MRQRVIIIGAGIVGAAVRAGGRGGRVSRHGHRCEVARLRSDGGGHGACPGDGRLAGPVRLVSSLAEAVGRARARVTGRRGNTSGAARCGWRPMTTRWERCVASTTSTSCTAYRHACSTGPAFAAAEPQLRPGLAGGLLLDADSVVYPPVVARWMLDRLAAGGHAIRIGANVASVTPGRVTLDDGATLEADFVVIAAGVKSAALVAEIPIRYRKGHLVITDRYKHFVTRQVLELGYLKSAHGSDEDSVAFNVQPRPTGQLLIGSSRQFDVTAPRDRPSHFTQDDRPRDALHAGPRRRVGAARLDGLPRRHARFAADHRPDRRPAGRPARHRPRGPGALRRRWGRRR